MYINLAVNILSLVIPAEINIIKNVLQIALLKTRAIMVQLFHFNNMYSKHSRPELIAYTLNQFKSLLKDRDVSLNIFWVFPYFLEKKIQVSDNPYIKVRGCLCVCVCVCLYRRISLTAGSIWSYFIVKFLINLFISILGEGKLYLLIPLLYFRRLDMI